MKIMILGAGAMGSLYGGLLKKAGEDVTLIDVNPSHIEAINKNGLIMQLDEGNVKVTISACFAKDFSDQVDLIIVFTKSVYSDTALESVKYAIGKDTIVLSLQNGIGHEAVMSKYVSTDRIVIGTTNFPSDFVDNGIIRSHGKGATRMMSLDGHVDNKIEFIRDTFIKAGLNAELSDNVFKSIWEKVAFNSALNTLTSVTLLPQGYIGDTVEGKELAHTIVDEVVSVANKKGINADAEHVHQLVNQLFKEHYQHCPSMLQDVLLKRRTEVAFINGAVVKEAEKLNLKVPATKVLYQLVSIIEQNYDNRKTSR